MPGHRPAPPAMGWSGSQGTQEGSPLPIQGPTSLHPAATGTPKTAAGWACRLTAPGPGYRRVSTQGFPKLSLPPQHQEGLSEPGSRAEQPQARPAGTQSSPAPCSSHLHLRKAGARHSRLLTGPSSGLKIYTVAELCPKARGQSPNSPFAQIPPGWPYSCMQSFPSVLGSLAKYTAVTLKLV